MSVPDLARAVLAADSLDDAKALAREALAEPRRTAPLKVAAFELGRSIKTVRRYAKRGAGVLTTKGWIIDLATAAEMGRHS